jgi:hypothetical protein
MNTRAGFLTRAVIVVLSLGVGLALPRRGSAHCDTMDGPVVATARAALEKGEVTPVLKWVHPDQEGEVRDAFQRTLTVRQQSAAARDLADRYFFETLVRLHRAGEGAPYTGLKPAGEVEPGIAAADQALESGAVDALVEEVAERVSAGVRERFAHALEKKKHADESVTAGREFVEAYVEYVHYVERLFLDAERPAGDHESEGTETEGGHTH